MERLRKLVIANRMDQNNTSDIEEALKHKDLTTLEHNMWKLMKQLNDLDKETPLINNSQQTQGLEHRKADERRVNRTDNEQTLKRELTTKNEQNRMASPNEASIKNNHPPLATEPKKAENRHKQTPSTAAPSSYTTSPPPENEIINILLLGEIGVGKSTFINAFVNYLKFQTLTKAESCEPVVLIPVSFLLCFGDHFEEKSINLGDSDDLNNEDFNHPGQSVTQHCKSYVFKLNDYDGRRMRIIDTPGFGDTRGVDQDNLNMQHILEYINNLKYLNAICFLLKPNSIRIHHFQSCLTQILDVLGSDFRHNIVFCFTNSRSTFYTPGDTALLLKRILKTLSMDDLPFKKENTFCFDNESFRYLVALQNSIKFDDKHTNIYEMSWSKSANESNRLIDYISTRLSACPMRNEWKSIKHAQIEIVLMIRPMLEATRNILRNIILCKMESSNKSIKLFPKPIHRPGAICSGCPPYPIKVGNFWIAREITHEFRKKCSDCSCPTHKHVVINYVLNFEDSDSPPSYPPKKMIDMVHELCRVGAEFDYFLNHVVHSSQGDRFLENLERMIDEENELRQKQKPNRLNSELFKNLNDLHFQYEDHTQNLKPNSHQIALANIYKSITEIRQYPMIQDQIDAIKETQKMMTEPYEVSQN